ncbi:MAG TPA: glycosyl hydrolase family 28-related protein, partial [Gemmatimonadaceae bacterium]|nr:glycosyl hydrolase family 28-related protein [Gemmatimonadaceae bacterium]
MERRTFLAGAGPSSAALLSPWLGGPPSAAPETGGIRDVRSFGAVGDNVHDDSPAIQKAIDADPHGGTVFFPQGVYRIEAPILLRTDTVLIGHGRHTVLSATTPGTAMLVLKSVRRIFIEGLYLNAQTGGKGRDGIVIDGCDDTRIRACWITGAGNRGIVANGTGPMIIDTTVELSTSHGIAVSQTNSGIPLQIIGCSIYANGGDGIHFEANANQSMVVANEILSNKGAGIR